MKTLNTALDALDVEVTGILEEIDRLRAVNKQLRNALEEITPAYEELLTAYGKPFGWGHLLSETARAALKAAS